jgi:phosphatidate phosphatase APP1
MKVRMFVQRCAPVKAKRLAFYRPATHRYSVAGWTKHLAQLGSAIDDQFDALKFQLRKRAGSFHHLQVLPYRGFGNSHEFYLKGRVLRETRPATLDKANLWDNLLATYRRFHSVEVPGAIVRITHGTESTDVLTDGEGYFELHLTNDRTVSAEPWRKIEVQLLGPKTKDGKTVTATAPVLVPPATARFGIISDIDDTIIISKATNLVKVAYHTFMQNARSRVAFPGVAAFYRALQRGTNEKEFNPIFYVSSGPWNLYDLLIDFMRLNEIPLGPILLQDYGVDETKLFSASHRDHKMAQIRKLLETYPDLPFILIGDSGQHDPEIYRKVLEEVPTRIKAIYIRDVTGTHRAAEIHKLAKEVREHGGELLFVKNSLEAAKHAVEMGLISASSLPEVSGEKREDEAAAATDVVALAPASKTPLP